MDLTSKGHPIGVVAERTGLSADVLRVWERRYGAVVPKRGPKGRRQYTDADIERLRLLRRASAGGRSIGEVAGLGAEALAALVRDDETEQRLPRMGTAAERAEEASLLEQSFGAVSDQAPERLEAVLRRSLAALGLGRSLEGVVAPLLRRIGEAWHAGRLGPGHEHVASGVTRRVLERSIGDLPPGSDAPVLLLATPAGDRHELGLLLVAGAAALEGWRSVVLGCDLPASEIGGAARRLGPRAVAISAVQASDLERVAREFEAVRRLVPPELPILAGGAAAERLGGRLSTTGVRVIGGLGELRAVLAALSPE
jgi:DNA-binding transcriptional MerR regulator/methylmalonyl-CoA mutase cobalamin-binding subunit